MRVAMLGPIAWRTPPRAYGPWEEVVSLLTERFVGMGLDVTLFATGESQTRARLVPVVTRGYEEDRSYDVKTWEALHVAGCFEAALAGEFDVIHNHFDFLPLTFSRLVPTPVVTTIHGFSSERIIPAYVAYDDRVHYVSISDSDRHPELHYAATIHHGIDLAMYPFRAEPDRDGHLLAFGRIHPDKGTAAAIALARRCGRPLKIAGIVQDQDYFRTSVEPELHGGIEYLGVVDAPDRAAVLGAATALVHLIGFDEPFGLSVIEALACGTPVLAADRGSMRELLLPGVTGDVVDTVDDAVAAVEHVATLDRRSCRADAAARFSADRMAVDYVALFRAIVDGQRRPSDRSASSRGEVSRGGLRGGR